MNTFDQLSCEDQDLLAEVLSSRVPDLIESFLNQDWPSREQSRRVDSAVGHSLEFVGEDYEPTERTLRLERLIGRDYDLWPSDREVPLPP